MGGRAFLTAAVGFFDWKVVGWAFSGGLEAVHTAMPAAEATFASRNARNALLFRSDRGDPIRFNSRLVA
jgi:transposase InsO family protein